MALDVLPKLVEKDIVVAAGLHKAIATQYFRVGHMGVTVTDSSRGDVDRVIHTHKMRTRNERYDPGGGGINVARVICRLGGEVRSVYLSGGATGVAFDGLVAALGLAATKLEIAEPTRVASPADIERGVLSLLFEFEDLLITTLPPLARVEALRVGRLPDCDVFIDDASVSKHHASLGWTESPARCTVRDVGSTNGTFLNAHLLGTREAVLRDGDILSFGNVQFWFLLTDTLHARLRAPRR